jgi:hypothetical protein
MEKTRRLGKEVKTTWHAATPFEEVWVPGFGPEDGAPACF